MLDFFSLTPQTPECVVSRPDSAGALVVVGSMADMATTSIVPPGLPGRSAFRSLGLWTDLWVLGHDTVVLETPGALAVRTPALPTFRWGNVLVLRRAMRPGDAAAQDDFRRLVACDADLGHVTLAWDDPTGGSDGVADLEAAGFEIERVGVLCAPSLGSAAVPPGVTLRPLDGDADWAAALEFQVAMHQGSDGGAAYRRFRVRRAAGYRAMAEAGFGRWYGAFHQGAVVADLGIYLHDGVARYQAVQTHPDYRGRGIASALLAEAARYAVEDRGAGLLVILADADGRALGLYRRLGFALRERLNGAVWRAADPAGAPAG